MAHPANASTRVWARAPSSLTVRPEAFDRLLAEARIDATALPAWIHGVEVNLITEEPHLAAFWKENWGQRRGAATGRATLWAGRLRGGKPHAYYCPERDEALLANTDYYGQCKSWALGMAGALLHRTSAVHSVHGASLEWEGRTVLIVGGSGAGKSTQVAALAHRGGRLMGDDWAFVEPRGEALWVTQPEACLYVRTDLALRDPALAKRLGEALLENAVTVRGACTSGACRSGECMFDRGQSYCLWGHPNGRALVPREWLAGPAGLSEGAPLGLVAVLYRDPSDALQLSTDQGEVLSLLRDGVRAGPQSASVPPAVPYANPYLLAFDAAGEAAAFARETAGGCLLLNTSHLTIPATTDAILGAARHA
ncbi:MAG: hypothetical protein ACYDBQ_07900 [Thermoplasmatota archaeon]